MKPTASKVHCETVCAHDWHTWINLSRYDKQQAFTRMALFLGVPYDKTLDDIVVRCLSLSGHGT